MSLSARASPKPDRSVNTVTPPPGDERVRTVSLGKAALNLESAPPPSKNRETTEVDQELFAEMTARVPLQAFDKQALLEDAFVQGERRRALEDLQALNFLSHKQLQKAKELFETYAQCSKNGNMTITLDNFKDMLSTVFGSLEESYRQKLAVKSFTAIDVDVSGHLDWNEFLWYYSKCLSKLSDSQSVDPDKEMRKLKNKAGMSLFTKFQFYDAMEESIENCYDPKSAPAPKDTHQQILFAYINQFRPRCYDIPTPMKLFVPSYQPSLGDAFIPNLMVSPDMPENVPNLALPEENGEVEASPGEAFFPGTFLDRDSALKALPFDPDMGEVELEKKDALLTAQHVEDAVQDLLESAERKDSSESRKALMKIRICLKSMELRVIFVSKYLNNVLLLFPKVDADTQTSLFRLMVDLAYVDTTAIKILDHPVFPKMIEPRKETMESILKLVKIIASHVVCQERLMNTNIIKLMVSTWFQSDDALKNRAKDICEILNISEDKLTDEWQELSAAKVQAVVRGKLARRMSVYKPHHQSKKKRNAHGEDDPNVSRLDPALKEYLLPLWREIHGVKEDLKEMLKLAGVTSAEISPEPSEETPSPLELREETRQLLYKSVVAEMRQKSRLRKERADVYKNLLFSDKKDKKPKKPQPWYQVIRDMFPHVQPGTFPMQADLDAAEMKNMNSSILRPSGAKRNAKLAKVYKYDQVRIVQPAPPKKRIPRSSGAEERPRSRGDRVREQAAAARESDGAAQEESCNDRMDRVIEADDRSQVPSVPEEGDDDEAQEDEMAASGSVVHPQGSEDGSETPKSSQPSVSGSSASPIVPGKTRKVKMTRLKAVYGPLSARPSGQSVLGPRAARMTPPEVRFTPKDTTLKHDFDKGRAWMKKFERTFYQPIVQAEEEADTESDEDDNITELSEVSEVPSIPSETGTVTNEPNQTKRTMPVTEFQGQVRKRTLNELVDGEDSEKVGAEESAMAALMGIGPQDIKKSLPMKMAQKKAAKEYRIRIKNDLDAARKKGEEKRKKYGEKMDTFGLKPAGGRRASQKILSSISPASEPKESKEADIWALDLLLGQGYQGLIRDKAKSIDANKETEDEEGKADNESVEKEEDAENLEVKNGNLGQDAEVPTET